MSEPHLPLPPLRERFAPQFSVKLLLVLTTVAAIVFAAVRAGAAENFFWAKCVSVVLGTALLCLLCYTGMFCIAWLFATLSGAVLEPFERKDPS